MDNMQQITNAVQKGLQLIVPASVQQGSTRQTRLRTELCNNDSFHAVLALSCGQAECKCQLPRNLTFGPGYSVQIKDVTNEKKLMKTA